MRNIFKNHRIAVLVVALVLGIADSSLAVDGVVEINHAAALAGGVTATDAPGYPVTIDSSGSYRLTGNLVIPDENTRGVEVGADSVSIDLNGFEIAGSVVCSGTPVSSCLPAGTGDGIFSNKFGTTVVNGTVRGSGGNGIHLTGWGPRVEGMRVYDNGLTGILIDAGGLVKDNLVFRNGQLGIRTMWESLIIENKVWENGADGIQTGAGLVIRSVSSENAGFGMVMLFSGYAQSVISGNVGGTVDLGIPMGNNVCNGNTTCP